jgi:hypothetical protein
MQNSSQSGQIVINNTQPLIGIETKENGQPVTRFFGDEKEADQALSETHTEDIKNLAGIWGDLNWQDISDSLDHIRHEDNSPSPSIDL